jgi:hypothetical protein
MNIIPISKQEKGPSNEHYPYTKTEENVPSNEHYPYTKTEEKGPSNEHYPYVEGPFSSVLI